MPEPRTIACPHCGIERQTKAGAGNRVRCTGCGKLYLTPRGSIVSEPPDDGAQEPTTPVPAAATAVPSPAAAASASRTTVKVADRVTITKAAKPRLPKVEATPEPAPVPPAPVADPVPAIPAAVAGRRGGLGSSMYRRIHG